MVEHLPNIHKVIGLILRTTKKKKRKRRKRATKITSGEKLPTEDMDMIAEGYAV